MWIPRSMPTCFYIGKLLNQRQRRTVRARTGQKNPYGYYGGSSRATRYQHYVEEAGEQAPASAAWKALHLKDDMPEEAQATIQKQADTWMGYERTWYDAHPDYPAHSSIPFEDQIVMADQTFPTSKAKGKIPLIGPASLTKSKSRKTTSSSATTAGIPDYVQQIKELSERQMRDNQNIRTEMSLEFAEIRHQMGLGRPHTTSGDQSGWDTWGSSPPVQHATPPSYTQPADQSGWGTWPSQTPQQPQPSGYQNIQMTNEEWERYQ